MDSVPAPVPSSVLLWGPEPPSDPATGTPMSVCCLRSTTAGARAAVYRTAVDQGIIGVVEFLSDAFPRPEGGWAAHGLLHRIEPGLPRAALLDDEHLRPVFLHIRGRRRLPVAAGQRLAALVERGPAGASPS